MAHDDHFRNRHLIEHLRYGVAHVRHHQTNVAPLHVLAIPARLIGGAARAGNRCKGPIDDADYVANFDFASGARKHVAAARPPAAVNDAGSAQIPKDRIEEFLGDIVSFGNLDSLGRLSRLKTGEVDERLETVLPLCSEHASFVIRLAGSMSAIRMIYR